MSVSSQGAGILHRKNLNEPDSLIQCKRKHLSRLCSINLRTYLKVFVSLDQQSSMALLLLVSWVILYSGGPIILAEASPPAPLIRPPGKAGPMDEDLCKKLGILCVHGSCVNDSEPHCKCYPGWKGAACDTCGGRMMYVAVL